jgi:hypothetical protein
VQPPEIYFSGDGKQLSRFTNNGFKTTNITYLSSRCLLHCLTALVSIRDSWNISEMAQFSVEL